MDKSPLKIVIVGNVNSGKTWLWQSYFQNRRPSAYIQTVFDNYCTNVSYNGKQVTISIFETCGEDDYSELRTLLYPGTHVVIFCTSIDSSDNILSKQSIEKWSHELKTHCKGVPIIVVGTKKDLRDDSDVIRRMAEQKVKPLKLKDVNSIAKKFKNSTSLECSSLTRDGLNIVFQTAVKMGLRNQSISNK